MKIDENLQLVNFILLNIVNKCSHQPDNLKNFLKYVLLKEVDLQDLLKIFWRAMQMELIGSKLEIQKIKLNILLIQKKKLNLNE